MSRLGPDIQGQVEAFAPLRCPEVTSPSLNVMVWRSGAALTVRYRWKKSSVPKLSPVENGKQSNLGLKARLGRRQDPHLLDDAGG